MCGCGKELGIIIVTYGQQINSKAKLMFVVVSCLLISGQTKAGGVNGEWSRWATTTKFVDVGNIWGCILCIYPKWGKFWTSNLWTLNCILLPSFPTDVHNNYIMLLVPLAELNNTCIMMVFCSLRLQPPVTHWPKLYMEHCLIGLWIR